MFDPARNSWTQILESDRARFLAPAPPFNWDEESSGIIEITSILGRNDGRRYFLANIQAHYDIPGELVQGGQLYVISVVPQRGSGIGTLRLNARGLSLVCLGLVRPVAGRGKRLREMAGKV
jgi:hypothetical protein